MSERTGTSSRQFLATTIRRLREEDGMTRDDLARAVFVSESLVRSWERGKRVPQPDQLVKLDEIFKTRGILHDLRLDLINSATPLEWMEEWRQAETIATTLLWFETIVIPGLLQTPDYATAVFQMAEHRGDVAKMVGERMHRQDILTREDDAPTLVVVISQAVLLNNVGGPTIMHGQLTRLLEVAKRSNVFIHIVPLTAGVGAGFLAMFIVAGLDNGDVAYVDNQLNGRVIEEPENVAILRRMFERFRAHALSQPESIDLIKKTLEEQWTQ